MVRSYPDHDPPHGGGREVQSDKGKDRGGGPVQAEEEGDESAGGEHNRNVSMHLLPSRGFRLQRVIEFHVW